MFEKVLSYLGSAFLGYLLCLLISSIRRRRVESDNKLCSGLSDRITETTDTVERLSESTQSISDLIRSVNERNKNT